MKFRAGFRRVDVPTPTEYNLQYTWKSPAPDHAPQPQGHTPLLQAENLLNSQTGPSNYASNQQQLAHNGHHQNGDIRVGEGAENSQDFEQLESHDNSLQSDAVDGIDDSTQFPGQNANIKVPKLQLASDKNSPTSGKSKHAHCSSKAAKKKPKSHHYHASHHHASKKHKGGGGGGRHSKVFVSEYKRQFKVWPIPSSTSGTKGGGHSAKKEKNENGKYIYIIIIL